MQSCASAPGRRSNPRISAWLAVEAPDLPCPHRSAGNEGTILSHGRKKIAPLTHRLDLGSFHFSQAGRLSSRSVAHLQSVGRSRRQRGGVFRSHRADSTQQSIGRLGECRR
jgi:hypothetical protein